MSLERFQYDSDAGLTLIMEKHQEHDQSTHGNWALSEINPDLLTLGTFDEESEYDPDSSSNVPRVNKSGLINPRHI